MANDLNYCSFIGRLGKDADGRHMPNGDPVTSFSIAVGESWKGKDGNKVEKTEWINCVAFKGLADVCATYLKKGSKIFVSGRMRTREWEKDGVKRYSTEIVVDQMQMLDSRADSAGESGSSRTNENGDAGPRAETPPKQSFDDFDDDIPF